MATTRYTDAINDQHCFVLAGLAGSGKSTAMRMIQERIEERGAQSITAETSDHVRTKFEKETGDGANDNELGRWAEGVKAERGDDYFVREMAEQYLAPNGPHVVLSGIRSPAEVRAVQETFGAVYTTVIAVWTLPDKRFERKYGDKPRDDHPKWDEFCERNERELHDWQFIDVLTDESYHDHVVPNNGPIDAFEIDLHAIVDEVVFGDDTDLSTHFYPFPTHDPDIVAQYC